MILSTDEFIATAFYPVWVLGSIAVVAVGIYGTVRCFQLERKVSGFGFIVLVVAWLAAQPLYPLAMLVAAYCEAHCDNTRISVAYLSYLGFAGILCVGILRSVRKAK